MGPAASTVGAFRRRNVRCALLMAGTRATDIPVRVGVAPRANPTIEPATGALELRGSATGNVRYASCTHAVTCTDRTTLPSPTIRPPRQRTQRRPSPFDHPFPREDRLEARSPRRVRRAIPCGSLVAEANRALGVVPCRHDAWRVGLSMRRQGHGAANLFDGVVDGLVELVAAGQRQIVFGLFPIPTQGLFDPFPRCDVFRKDALDAVPLREFRATRCHGYSSSGESHVHVTQADRHRTCL